MSFNKFLNNKITKLCDHIVESLSPTDRNADEYFFNKSDLDKMCHYKNLTNKYKLSNKIYFYYNESSNIWVEETSEDSVIYRICEYSRMILDNEKIIVLKLLNDKLLEFTKKGDSITVVEKNEFDTLKETIKEFNKFIEKNLKDHMKAKWAKSILSFFNNNIIDNEFINKININNENLLPIKNININLITGKTERRNELQNFTKFLDFDSFMLDCVSIKDGAYKEINNFFLDICSGSVIKLKYLQKIIGYFLTGNVKLGRCFYIFFGAGRNGKSAVFELLNFVLNHYCKALDPSIIVKKGSKNAGQASPELEALDYGLRVAVLSETEEKDKLNEEMIKKITGGDAISYRALYGKQKQFMAECKLVMLTNNKPYFKLSTSMCDRIRFLHFKSRFIDTEPKLNERGEKINKNEYKADPNLINRFKSNEYKYYLLLWMIEGSKSFYKDGHMNIPDDEEIKLDNLSYINEMDSFKRFCDDCIIENIGSKILSSDIKDKYKKYCIDEDIPMINPKELKTLMDDKYIKVKDCNNYYKNIKFVDENEANNESFNDDVRTDCI